MAKKKPKEKVDGLSPDNKAKVRSAIRQVWQRSSYARKLAKERCIDEDGFFRCEECKKRVPEIQIDHIKPCGDLLSKGFIERLFCSSDNLRGLCKKCHKIKTAEDKAKGLT